MKKYEWNWKPCVSVGAFCFGEYIAAYFKEFDIVPVPEEYDDDVGWEVYSIPGTDIRIYTRNSRIISINIDDHLNYRSKNLIGMKLSDVCSLLGKEPDEFGEPLTIGEEDQITVEFDSSGLQLWLSEDIVAGAVCTSPEFFDEDLDEEN